ncbi:MAG: phosphoglycerate dehydrogenase, partial [Clostridia bacterium]|nr:phosphoglycerate dehydrogenase [Clostridia bacterium]
MKPIVALNSATQASAFCEEARQMLLDAGFELRCNPGIRPTPDQLKEMVAGAYAIVAGTEKYTADVLEAADQLKVIIRFGVGTDNLDLNALREKGIQVGVITNYNAVAEFALTLILSAMKNLPRFDTAARDGKWSRFPMR